MSGHPDYRDRPAYHLVRRFVGELFDLGFLSESSGPGIARTIGGVAAVLLALGALLARGFMTRYAMANDPHTGGPLVYHQVALADHFFLIGVTMWIVAFVTVLIASSLFPDETDFRVLMVLPVSRRLIFGAKVAAVGCFVAIFVVTAEAALFPLFTVTIISPHLDHFPLALFGAYLIASLAGGLFAGVAVMAVQALLLLAVPRRILSSTSAAVSSLMLFALVASLPLLGRFTARGSALEGGAGWLWAVPPAWFAGLEQRILGDERFTGLATVALSALVGVCIVSAGAYLILYRHFEQVMVRPAPRTPAASTASHAAGRVAPLRRPAFTAVRHFTSLTLRRSPLHQGVLAAIAAIGVALVVNSLIDIDFRVAWDVSAPVWRRNEVLHAVVWAPFPLVFVTAFAIRASLLVPIEPRANWVFRMTERPAFRLQQIDAAAWTMRTIGVVLPAMLLLPLQWFVLGPWALAPTAVAVLSGGLIVEILFLGWRRIPFTCSYLIGKGFVPLVVLRGLLAFFLYTTLGSALAHIAYGAPPVFGIVIGVMLLAAIAGLHRMRRGSQEHVPLEFEDSLPTEVSPLRLTPY
jgi:hypothetical protein